MAASPLICVRAPVRSRRMALRIVTGRTRSISFVRLRTLAIAMAPKATCERPSPIKEKRFRTSVTPSSEEQSAMRTPTMSA